jgi:hypothetical protein
VLLALAVGCQLTSADEVVRSPSVGRGNGGSSGRDVAAEDQEHEDCAPLELGRPDVASFLDVAWSSSRYDAALDRSSLDAQAVIDGIGVVLDTAGSAETISQCNDDAQSVCDDFDARDHVWSSTGGNWTIRSDDFKVSSP